MAILFLSTAVGVTVAWRANRAVERMLRANYDTLVFCQSMVDATARLDNAVWNWAFGRNSADWAAAQEEFDHNLELQQKNVTEPGEQALTDLLTRQWRNFKFLLDDYRSSPQKGRIALYQLSVQPREAALLLTCHAIVGVNLKAVPKVSERAQLLAHDAAQWGISLLTLATILVSIGVVLLGRWVINPIRAVTESARQIAGGNLDLEVGVHGWDEVGELAASFNQMAGSLRDLRRSDREKLINFKRSTQRTLDALIDGVAFLDAQGRVELSNPVAQRMFGLRPDQAPGPACPPELSGLLAKCLSASSGFAPRGYEGILQVFDAGRERFFLPRVEAVSDDAGGLAGLALVLLDVTGLRNMDEMKSGVVSTVSHELKTPLTGLRMALHLLLDEKNGSLNPQQEELALAARQDAERLHEILMDLLDIGKLESGQGSLVMEPLSVYDLMDQAVKQQQPSYQAKGVRLAFKSPLGDVRVQADPTRLRHVFSNLLDNALRYTPPGGTVELRAESDATGVRFSVQDNGEGIAPELLPRLFEKFFRAPEQSSPGAGLGLAIVKEIMVAHGGGIDVRSVPGQGSTFTFQLPPAVRP
ncbi:MAG TPA: ATP-binding protein [bacterium]|nr:ATP-binding protein [bacterium]